MLECDRQQYEREIQSAQRELTDVERDLDRAIAERASASLIEGYRERVSKARSNLDQAIWRRNTDYYGRPD